MTTSTITVPEPSGIAIDVSTYQLPSLTAALAPQVQHVDVRASHGEVTDSRFTSHVMLARRSVASVGAYHFFQVEVPVDVQLATLATQMRLGGFAAGDVVPALDLERNGSRVPGPSWNGPAEAFCAGVRGTCGSCRVYLGVDVFLALGEPSWVLEHGLWLAQYRAGRTFRVPGTKVPLMIQHRVGKFDPDGPGGYFAEHPQVDQSWIFGPLPRIGADLAPAG